MGGFKSTVLALVAAAASVARPASAARGDVIQLTPKGDNAAVGRRHSLTQSETVEFMNSGRGLIFPMDGFQGMTDDQIGGGASAWDYVIESVDSLDNPIHLTGSFMVPATPATATAFFFQGTYTADRSSPSAPTAGLCTFADVLANCGATGLLGSAMVALGMLGVFPDYAGLSGMDPLPDAPPLPWIHSYIQTPTYERTTEDVLKAIVSLAGKPINGDGPIFNANYHVVTTGYSQGGFAALASAVGMASGRASLPSGFKLAASAPQAGPYDPAATYDGTELNGYAVAMYVPYLVLGALAEKGRKDLMGDIFAADWTEKIIEVFSGEFSNGEIGEQLPPMITEVFAAGLTESLFKDLAVYVDGKFPDARPELTEPEVKSGDSKEKVGAWLMWAMVQPNVLASAANAAAMASTPTHFCHSDADEQVDVENTRTAFYMWKMAGNANTVLKIVDDGSLHSAAALKCIPEGLDFLWKNGADVAAAVGADDAQTVSFSKNCAKSFATMSTKKACLLKIKKKSSIKCIAAFMGDSVKKAKKMLKTTSAKKACKMVKKEIVPHLPAIKKWVKKSP